MLNCQLAFWMMGQKSVACCLALLGSEMMTCVDVGGVKGRDFLDEVLKSGHVLPGHQCSC